MRNSREDLHLEGHCERPLRRSIPTRKCPLNRKCEGWSKSLRSTWIPTLQVVPTVCWTSQSFYNLIIFFLFPYTFSPCQPVPCVVSLTAFLLSVLVEAKEHLSHNDI
ncbi:unnamed protein product, partial [Musa textilis]